MGKYLHELEVLQNAAARIVTRSPKTTRLSKMYKELGWLRLTSMFITFNKCSNVVRNKNSIFYNPRCSTF